MRFSLMLSSCVQDYDSVTLKNKKHWNSFTTSFFVELPDAIAQLQSKARLDINVSKAESMLKQDLVCHVCRRTARNMPLLKAHISACKP